MSACLLPGRTGLWRVRVREVVPFGAGYANVDVLARVAPLALAVAIV